MRKLVILARFVGAICLSFPQYALAENAAPSSPKSRLVCLASGGSMEECSNECPATDWLCF